MSTFAMSTSRALSSSMTSSVVDSLHGAIKAWEPAVKSLHDAFAAKAHREEEAEERRSPSEDDDDRGAFADLEEEERDGDGEEGAVPLSRFSARRERRWRTSRRLRLGGSKSSDVGEETDDDGGAAEAMEEGRGRGRSGRARRASETKPRPAAASDDPLVLFGYDISSLSPSAQFSICASGVFCLTIVYGYLQELLSVHVAGRRYALFLASAQYAGCALWSAALQRLRRGGGGKGKDASAVSGAVSGCSDGGCVPLRLYVGLSIIRSVDVGMTNLAMQFLNYPAKLLIKSSRVAFTMLLGLVIGRKRYRPADYAAVAFLVIGLGVFLRANARSDTVFHSLGVAMLIISLICDGIVANWSEIIMRRRSISQDEFQARLYSTSFVVTALAAHLKGELLPGLHHFLLVPGTVSEIYGRDPAATSSSAWTPSRKAAVLLLFSASGLFGSSCAGAIARRFGSLGMSVASTARIHRERGRRTDRAPTAAVRAVCAREESAAARALGGASSRGPPRIGRGGRADMECRRAL